MPYHKLHKYKDAHHYVCADVLSDGSSYYMPYYTHCIPTDAHHYVCVDVLSGGLND
jgi:hypothetical protein